LCLTQVLKTYLGYPFYDRELYRATPWYVPTLGTLDYFSICSMKVCPYNCDIPKNFRGYLNARTGNAYACLSPI